MDSNELRRIVKMLRLGNDITEYAESKLLIIADDADSKQLLQSRVVGRSEQLTCKNHPYGNTYTSITGALCCVKCFEVIKAS